MRGRDGGRGEREREREREGGREGKRELYTCGVAWSLKLWISSGLYTSHNCISQCGCVLDGLA
jgi:hypothetical protein